MNEFMGLYAAYILVITVAVFALIIFFIDFSQKRSRLHKR
ncbi:MAG: hypothetical protein FD145_877 [Candidatus Saganbacteria bacterium]|uniref:Uncharacterized protein n=1 Tax=Candidatus Saganbacteria bacterium TaxID=2575572 RepID=A0A833L141_UNCSA|nr:MAG: hypothetical protein FD145_877 [Candidatus Saganbacteria bacterium]